LILADTSVWADHLRRTDPFLSSLLEHCKVITHPFVIGELAMGNLSRRDAVLADLNDMPKATLGDDGEVLRFVARNALFRTGIGYIDAHLLVATQLTPETWLWTRDKRLLGVAQRLRLAMPNAPPRTQ